MSILLRFKQQWRKFLLLTVIALIGISQVLFAQNIFSGEPVQVVGKFNGYATTPYNSDYRTMSFRRVSTSTGTPTDGRGQWATTINVQSTGGDITPFNMTGGGGEGFLFISGPSGNRFQNKWTFSGVGQGALNAINNFSAYNSGQDMGLNMSTAGYYTFVFNDAGYTATNAKFYVGLTSSAPISINSVAATPVNDGSGTIQITTSSAISPEEKVFVRYKTGANDFSGSTSIVEATGSGTSYSATIPAQPNNTTVWYYAFTSTRTLSQLSSDSEGNKTLSALRYNDNSGSNYSYTTCVSLAPTATTPQSFCSASNPTVANLAATGTSIKWYDAATNGNLLATTTALSSTNYYASQTINGCESNRTLVTVTITSSVTPSVSISASTTTICSGTVVTFTPTPTNGGGSPSYQWKKNDADVSTGSSFAPNNLVNGDKIKVVMTSNDACASPTTATSNEITITVEATPANPTASVTQPTCTTSTGSITITAPSSGVLYSFDNGTTFGATNVLTGLSPNSYLLKVKSSGAGCVSTATTVNVNPQPSSPSVSNVSTTLPVNCSGGAITITASGATEYSTNGGTSYQASNTFSGLGCGAYAVKVRNASGCEATYSNNPVAFSAPAAATFLMQGFNYDFPKAGAGFTWADTLRLKAACLKKAGFTHLWFPGHYGKGSYSSGYDPRDLYMGETTGMGTPAQIRAMITELNNQGIDPMGDFIYNHRDGGSAEKNPAVEEYIQYKAGGAKKPYPSDRYHVVIPLGGSSGNGAGDYYINIDSRTGTYSGAKYMFYATTAQKGGSRWSPLLSPDGVATEQTGAFTVDLGRNYETTIDNNGDSDEFKVTITNADFNAAGDQLIIYMVNTNGYADQRIWKVWNGTSDLVGKSGGTAAANVANVYNDVVEYHTYTDFSNMPSGLGSMNWDYFRPNYNPVMTGTTGNWNVDCLCPDWSQNSMDYFYDYDHLQTKTANALIDWTKWNFTNLGIKSIRMDAVKHLDASFFGNMLNQLNASGNVPSMVIGEYYDASPSVLQGWIRDVYNNGFNSSLPASTQPRVFDFTLRETLRNFTNNRLSAGDVRQIYTSGLVGGGYLSANNVVTFLNNHDFRNNYGANDGGALIWYDPMLAYAYLLTNNQIGVPTVYYDDYYGYPAASSAHYRSYMPTTLTPMKCEIDALMDVHKKYIFGSPSLTRLNASGSGYSGNYSSGSTDKALIYQLQGPSSTNKDIIVAINFSDSPLKVDHPINTRGGAIATGTRFTDMLRRSAFPYAQVNASGQIYIELPARSYSVWVQGSDTPITPKPTATANTGVCVGGTLNLTGGVESNSTLTDVSYSWSGPDGFTSTAQNPQLTNVTAAKAGTYTLTVRYNCDFCQSTSTTVNVSINAQPTVSAPSTSVCVGSTITLSPTSGGTWTSSDDTKATVTNAGVVTGVAAGSVTFTFTETASGCSATTSSVTVKALPTVSAPSTSVCVGSIITLSPVSGGTWTSSDETKATVTNAGVVTGVATGSVTFTFTETASGCSATTSSVTVKAQPTVSSPSTSVCIGSTITLSPVSGGTWTSSDDGKATVTNAGVVTGVAAGSVTFTFTETASGCSATTSSVTVKALPTVSAPSTSVCIGSTITLSPVSGGTWTSSDDTKATVTNAGVVTGVAAGSVTFTFTETASGCSATTSSVTVKAKPTVSAPSTSVCIGSTLTLSPVSGGRWISSDDTKATVTNAGVVTGVAAGSVTFTFTETASGCSATTSSVTVKAQPTVSAPSTSVCIGSTLTLSPVSGGTWISSDDTKATVTNAGVVTGVAAGSVTFTFTETASGCSATTSSVTVKAQPTVSTPSTSVCVSSTITLSPTSGGTWTSSDDTKATVTNAGVVTGVAAGSATFTFTETASGCSATTSSVTVKALPTVSAPSTSVCIGSTITLSPTSGGTWTSSDDTKATVTNAGVVTGVATGSATFTFTETASGCSATTSSVTVKALPTVSAPSTSVCIGSTITLSPVSGGTWISSDDTKATVTNAGVVTGVAAGSVTFTFTETASGCSATTSSVTVKAKPTVSAPSTSVCIGSTITLSPTSGGTWTSSDDTKATVTNAGVVTGVAAGSVTFTFTETASGCSATTSSVTVKAQPTVSAPSTSVCIGSTITLSPVSGGTWISSDDTKATVTNAGVVTGVAAGSATFTFTETASGCNATTSSVTVKAKPTVSAPSTSVCIGSTITLSPVSGGTWISSDDTKATVTNAGVVTGVAAGSVTFTFTETASGCSATTSSVTVKAKPTVSAPSTSVCIGSTITLSPTSGGTWTSSDDTKATVTNAGVVTGVAAGSVTFTFTETASGCSATTSSVTVNSPVTPTFSQLGPYCPMASPGTLPLISVNGITGTWNAPISTAAVGTTTYTFSPIPGQCATTATMMVQVSSSVTPTFTQLGPYCQGETPAILPTVSTNSIAGTWDAAIGTVNAGSTIYTFTPTGGACASSTTMSIQVNAKVTPLFTQLGPYCQGATLVALTSTSTNGVTGTWNAAISTVNAGSTTYIFTPTLGQCAVSTTMNVVVNSLPTASMSGTTTVCQNSASPMITFTGANATAPYTFTYKINDGAPQTVKTTSGNSVTVAAPTGTAGAFVYSLISVSESSSVACSQAQSGSARVIVQGKPTITLTTLQQTLNEGNSQVLCDIDANPVNGLQFTISGLCVVGSPVWRLQVGSGAWSDWSANAPVSQMSNNQPHRYQAACDASCPVTYTSPIELTINYRASIPQNVSMIADGVTVNAGETKEVCNIEGNTLTFNATCGVGEVLLYSVDGGDYSSLVPMQLVDGQYHNYRVRCRKSDGTVSCVETESGVMRLRITSSLAAPVASLNVTSGCGSPVALSGIVNCGALTTIWYNAVTNVALSSLPNQTPTETSSYYARCQAGGGCLSEKSNVVTYTVIPVGVAPAITASQDIVCTGTTVKISANCPVGSQAFWNTGVTASSFEVSFSNMTKQTYWAKCLFEGGCQSAESVRKDVYWNAFVVTLVNVGQPKSAVRVNDRSVWSSQFITRDGGPELEQSTQQNPTLYYVENANKVAPRYWTINVDACALGTDGSLTFDMLATPEMGVIRSFNTHENNAPYFMYANREGWTELYAQNHPAYGFYQDNGAGGNVYDLGLPKGLYKLGIRYWDQKGWGSIYPSTRKPQGNVLAYQEYWFRIQSKDGVGVGAARVAESEEANGQGARGEGQEANVKWQGSDNGKQITDNGAFATVMPNPVTHTLHLKVQESKGQVVQTSLTDAAGREVLRRNFVPETNTHQEEFGVSALPAGIYFLKVTTPDKNARLKVLKVQ